MNVPINVLFLYNNSIALKLFDALKCKVNNIFPIDTKIDINLIKKYKIDLIISYTYRYIITKEIIDYMDGNIVNLHISYLPFNKGSDPNIWSIIDDTPKGATLHYINAEIDKGDIIAQESIEFDECETLKSSYEELNKLAVTLFLKSFKNYQYWNEMRKRVSGIGSYHTTKDLIKVRKIIQNNYSLTIKEFKDLILKNEIM